jgi:hypothetical protein
MPYIAHGEAKALMWFTLLANRWRVRAHRDCLRSSLGKIHATRSPEVLFRLLAFSFSHGISTMSGGLMDGIDAACTNLRRALRDGLGSDAVADAIARVVCESAQFLRTKCDTVAIQSYVKGKRYFCFRHNSKVSRAVNVDLFSYRDALRKLALLCRGSFDGSSQKALDRALYSAAIAYCCVAELVSEGNRPSASAYFQWFVGHLFARVLGVRPVTSLVVQQLGIQIPTDYLFHVGPNVILHLPIKITTRERAVEAWTHQRVMDGILGVGRVRGILVCMSETNRVKRGETIGIQETCVPNQWLLYQAYVSQFFRVYYFDPPAAYIRLAKHRPGVQVREFSQFAGDRRRLCAP